MSGDSSQVLKLPWLSLQLGQHLKYRKGADKILMFRDHLRDCSTILYCHIYSENEANITRREHRSKKQQNNLQSKTEELLMHVSHSDRVAVLHSCNVFSQADSTRSRCIRARWIWSKEIKLMKIKTGHLKSYVKLNFKASLFSCNFWFEDSLLGKIALLVYGLFTL